MMLPANILNKIVEELKAAAGFGALSPVEESFEREAGLFGDDGERGRGRGCC